MKGFHRILAERILLTLNEELEEKE
jgi:hypothetical protein